MFDMILESSWAGPLLWAALYISDYTCTIACARMCRTQAKIQFEGSFEINPIYQGDVNALRRLSPRFCLILTASTGYLFLLRWVADPGSALPELYIFTLGAMLLMELTIHVRHFRNWFLFKKVVPNLRGRVEYPRDTLLQMSAFEILTFVGLYLALFFVTGSLFILGGAVTCFVLAIKHYRLARRHLALSPESD